jgi:hypothetical protein
MLTKYPKLPSDDQQEFAMDKALAESHLGLKQQALKELDSRKGGPNKNDDIVNPSEDLAAAEVNLYLGSAMQAHDSATRTAAHFIATGQLDSALRSTCIAARAAMLLKNSTEYNNLAGKAVDIASKIKETWGPQAFQGYMSRPDMQMLISGIM